MDTPVQTGFIKTGRYDLQTPRYYLWVPFPGKLLNLFYGSMKTNLAEQFILLLGIGTLLGVAYCRGEYRSSPMGPSGAIPRCGVTTRPPGAREPL